VNLPITDDAICGSIGQYGDHVSMHELIVVENGVFRGIYTKDGGVVAELTVERNANGLVRRITGRCVIGVKAPDFDPKESE